MLRLMPVSGFAALLIPGVGLLLNYWFQSQGMPSDRLEVLEFWWMGLTVVYWSLYMTALVGCSIAWAFKRGRTWLFSRPDHESR